MILDNKEATQLAIYFYNRDKQSEYDFEMDAVARGIIQGIGMCRKLQEFDDEETLKVLDIARCEIMKFYKQENIQYSNVLMLIDNLEAKINGTNNT